MAEPTTDLSSIRYVAHLPDNGDLIRTACGEPWQGWQAPAKVERRQTVPPHEQPHEPLIRQCQACRRVAIIATLETASGPGLGMDTTAVTASDTRGDNCHDQHRHWR